MSDSRLAGADFVRAAACCMVVASHVAQRVDPDMLQPLGARTQLWFMMGTFGVGVFFVLSGYLLARPFWAALDAGEPMPSLRTYALRRAARILPGYWLALSVAFIASFTLLHTPFDGILLFRYLSGVFLVADFHWVTWFPVEFDGPLWSIGCEITSYTLLALCLVPIFRLPAARGWRARAIWVGVLGLALGIQYVIVTWFQPDSFQRSWDYGLIGGAKTWMTNYNPIGFFVVFALGALAAGLQVRVAERRSVLFDLLALAGLAIAAVAMLKRWPDVDSYGIGNIPYAFPWFPAGVALILIGVPSGVWLKRATEIAPIAFLARISFGIYVWHFFFMEVVRVLWQPRYGYWGMTDVVQWEWISAAVAGAAIIVATLSYYMLEAPVIRWARGFEHRPIAASPTLSPAAG